MAGECEAIARPQGDRSVAVLDDLFAAARLTPYSLAMMSIGLAVTIAEGADISAMSAAAPLLIRHFGLSSRALGALLSFGAFGMIAATVALSPLVDRIGRRPAILIGLSLAVVASVLTTMASNTFWFMVSRILAGIGIGLTSPSIYALMAEIVPTRMRAMGTIIAGSGFLVGSALSSFLLGNLASLHGYRAPFLVAAGIETLVVAICSLVLTESPFLMVRKGAPAALLARLVRRLGGTVDPEVRSFVTRREKVRRGRVRTLVVEEHRAVTLLLWLSSFCTLGVAYLTTNWLPALLVRAGEDMGAALRFFALAAFASAVFSIFVALLTTRINAVKILLAGYASMTAAALLLGAMTGVSSAFYAVALVHYVVNAFAQFCMVGVANRYYSSEIRATGVGYVLGAGRLGAVVGPLAGGLLVSAGLTINGIFGFTAIPAGLACLSISFLWLSGKLRAGDRDAEAVAR